MFERVVLLAPHLDDVELSAGGVVAKLSEESHITHIGFYTPQERRPEFEASAEILGIDEVILFDFDHRTFPSRRREILQILYDYNQEHIVDLVLTPSTTDIHQDHQTVTNEAIRAFRQSTILGYEVPGNNIEFRQQCFVSLEEHHVAKKVAAVLCYKSQFEARGLRFSEEYVRAKTMAYGSHVRTKYAEAFEVIKLVIG